MPCSKPAQPKVTSPDGTGTRTDPNDPKSCPSPTTAHGKIGGVKVTTGTGATHCPHDVNFPPNT
jgi:hypothetical protein